MSSLNTAAEFYSEDQEPHVARRKAILEAHPEVRKLFGPTATTFWIALGVVAFQLSVGVVIAPYGWLGALIAAFFVGSIAVHAIHVIIHECAHNLVFKTAVGNRLVAIFANIPAVFPSAIAFQKYHLLHHRYQGAPDYDADIPGPLEAKIVGNSFIMKSLWLMVFLIIEGVVRPNRLKNVKLMDGWTVLNLVFEIACMALYFTLFGGTAFLYLVFSALFAVGFHPIGGRWIQEHFVFREGQETYSYYGIANITSLNVGYHNEHHDLMMVPWINLPKLNKMAPEFYRDLYCHRSYIKLFFRFLFDPKMDLSKRVARKNPEFKTIIVGS